MSNPLFNATVKATGKKVKVYKAQDGSWVDWDNYLDTFYQSSDLEIDKSKPMDV